MCIKCETGKVGPKDKENRVALGGIMKLAAAMGTDVPLPETVEDMPRYFEEAGKVLDLLAEHSDVRNILAYALMVTHELMGHAGVEEIAEGPTGQFVLSGIAGFGSKVESAIKASGAFSGEVQTSAPEHHTVH